MSLLELPTELLIHILHFLLPMPSASLPYLLMKNSIKQMAILQSVNSKILSERISDFTNEFWWNLIECECGIRLDVQKEKQLLINNKQMKRKCLLFLRIRQLARLKKKATQVTKELDIHNRKQDILILVFGNGL